MSKERGRWSHVAVIDKMDCVRCESVVLRGCV